jgi:hypothetical protein
LAQFYGGLSLAQQALVICILGGTAPPAFRQGPFPWCHDSGSGIPIEGIGIILGVDRLDMPHGPECYRDWQPLSWFPDEKTRRLIQHSQFSLHN